MQQNIETPTVPKQTDKSSIDSNSYEQLKQLRSDNEQLSRENIELKELLQNSGEQTQMLNSRIKKQEEEINNLQMELNNRPSSKQIKVQQDRIKELDKNIKKLQENKQANNQIQTNKDQTNTDYYNTISKLQEIFKVKSESELLSVASKVNKAIRALPILEGFCNDVCREVFEFEDTEIQLNSGNLCMRVDQPQRSQTEVIPILRKWKEAMIDSEEVMKTQKEVEKILAPVLVAMGVEKPSEMDVLVAIQSLKEGQGKNYNFSGED